MTAPLMKSKQMFYKTTSCPQQKMEKIAILGSCDIEYKNSI